jgi:hypothetical protein
MMVRMVVTRALVEFATNTQARLSNMSVGTHTIAIALKATSAYTAATRLIPTMHALCLLHLHMRPHWIQLKSP